MGTLPHPGEAGATEVPHFDGFIVLQRHGSEVRHTVSGEVAQLREDEVGLRVCLGGSLPRSFIVTTKRRVWASDVLQASVWQTQTGSRFMWSQAGGSAWLPTRGGTNASSETIGRSSGSSPSSGTPMAFCSAVPQNTTGRSSGSEFVDLSATLPEQQWYHAHEHEACVEQYVAESEVPRDLACLDLFSASQVIAQTWQQHGLPAAAADIQLGMHFDILGESGFFCTLQLLLRVQDGGLLFGGPPCSMFVWISSSVHQRSPQRPRGDESNFKVRMSNTIVANMAVLLRVATSRKVWWVVEQPASSLMFRLPELAQVAQGTPVVTTWMGNFGHPLAKCTHLRGTLPTLRRLTTAVPEKQGMPEGRSSGCSGHSSLPLGYYKVEGKRVTGGPRLHETATYTQAFAEAVFAAWAGTRPHSCHGQKDASGGDQVLPQKVEAQLDRQTDRKTEARGRVRKRIRKPDIQTDR